MSSVSQHCSICSTCLQMYRYVKSPLNWIFPFILYYRSDKFSLQINYDYLILPNSIQLTKFSRGGKNLVRQYCFWFSLFFAEIHIYTWIFTFFEASWTNYFHFYPSECHVVCHSKCSPSLPNLCGLPNSIVSQYTMHANNRSSMILDDGSVAIDVTDGYVPKIEGWLKYPRKWVLFMGGHNNVMFLENQGQQSLNIKHLRSVCYYSPYLKKLSLS